MARRVRRTATGRAVGRARRSRLISNCDTTEKCGKIKNDPFSTDRWRICFRFKDGDAYDVEIVDYHRG